MRTTRLFHSMLLTMALAGCDKTASPPPAASQVSGRQHPAFQLGLPEKRALVEKALMLKPGDSYGAVTNVLGIPTYDQSLDLKDGRNIGRGLKYYAVIWETNLVNELQDELVSVYLDKRGAVSSVDIKVTLGPRIFPED